jgi:Na+/H+ antiporter NhaD/arsenite permease-like protein
MTFPKLRGSLLLLIIPLILVVVVLPVRGSPESDGIISLDIIGRVLNEHGVALPDAEVALLVDGNQPAFNGVPQEANPILTERDGIFMIELNIPAVVIREGELTVEISKPGFRTTEHQIDQQDLACNESHCYLRVPDIYLKNLFNAAFFVATITFVLVFALIAFQVFHDTLTAFIGATIMLGVSYLLGTNNPDFWILSFERAITYVDFDVIFLILTLMIVVSIIGRTGVFQCLALSAYRSAQGNAWFLAIILMATTALLSAFLNNVTIMLLMAPITIEIALVLEIKPTALIIPEVFASNIGGVATLIGDPPNTVIGSYAGVGFNQFLIHMGPIAVISTLALIAVIYLIYHREYQSARQTTSPALLARLEKDAQITEPETLKRSLVVMGLMMFLFFTGDLFHMPPSVVGLIGATILLIWVQPNVEEMLREVDWTTLMFFMCLFIVVGGVQEVGLIQCIADLIAEAAGASALVAALAVIWLSAIASAIVNNIPFTTAALPIAAYLTRTIPGATGNVLYWSLSLGANLGGNATYVGSAPNVVAVGILERAGYRMKFIDFCRVGIPIAIVTIIVPTVWILVRYFLLVF